MSRCAVCGVSSSAVSEQVTLGGTRYGMACPGECQGLLWESHFVRATGAKPYECALVLWGWRKRRCEVEGKPFNEEPPKSPAEKSSERWASSFGGVE